MDHISIILPIGLRVNILSSLHTVIPYSEINPEFDQRKQQTCQLSKADKRKEIIPSADQAS